MSPLDSSLGSVLIRFWFRLPNRTICEKSCGCKTSLQFYLKCVGVVFAYLRSRIGSNQSCNRSGQGDDAKT